MMMQNDKKTTQMEMHRSKVFQQFNNIIVGSVNGSLFSSKDFSIKYFEAPGQVKVELTPLSKTMKSFMSTIVIVMDTKDFTATRIEMNEASGDNTILTFANKEINATLEDTLFALK
jgi:outer membrane lipoprotein-sorting protein